MKKLMIVAAAAAMTGVAMAECTELACPFAYRIKLAGKTVTGKTAASNVVDCADGGCWAKPTSLRIAGYFYGEQPEGKEDSCGEKGCGCIDKDTYVANKVFWDANKKEVTFSTVEFGVFEILRNSGAKNKAQILLKLDDLNLAGFGVYNPSTGRLKSASGFFAGKLAAPMCAGAYDAATCKEGEATPAQVYSLCDFDEKGNLNAADSAAAIAYGRWNLAWKNDKVLLAKEKGADWKNIVYPSAFKPASDND